MNNNVPNELDPILQGTGSNLDPWRAFVSSPRAQMYCTHTKQYVLNDAVEPRRCQAGTEREYGKYTFAIKMPCNGIVLGKFERYPPNYDPKGIKYNPETIIVYENEQTNEIGHISVVDHFFNHTSFGFKYDKDDQYINSIKRGDRIEAGTILAKPPNLREDGSYGIGFEANVALMSLAGTTEDGFIVSDEFLARIIPTFYGTRIVSWGKNQYPLNLYGTRDHYKPFPGPGDVIRDDGLVFVLRTFDEDTNVIEMTPAALLPDHIDDMFDRCVYARGGATVTDVDIHHNTSTKYNATPVGMETEAMRYVGVKSQFYKDIVNLYQRLSQERGEGLIITDQFHRLVVEALADDPKQVKGITYDVERSMNKVPLDEFRVEITYSYKRMPNLGFKLTDGHGSKGVVCGIWPKASMPVTDEGVVADIIMDPLTVIKRASVGQLYEQYTNATSWTVTEQVRQIISTTRDYKAAYDYLNGYYKVASPIMGTMVDEILDTKEKQCRHVDEVCSKGIYLHLPSNSPNIGPDQIVSMRKHFPIHHGSVTYTGRSGRRVRTVEPIIIASKYMMLLEKTGDEWSSVSVAKVQVHGLLAKLSKRDKYSSPVSENPVKITAESEIRLFTSFDSKRIAELQDRSNNPESCRILTNNILNAPQPSNVDALIDRNQHPTGQGKAHMYVKHTFQCGGILLKYKPFDPNLGPEIKGPFEDD